MGIRSQAHEQASKTIEEDLIKEGVYNVTIKKAWEKATANGNGVGYNIVYKITNGRFEGEEHYQWYAKELSTSPKVEQMHAKALENLCLAVDMDPEEIEELEGCNLRVEIKINNRDGNKQNQIPIEGYYKPTAGGKKKPAAVEGAVNESESTVERVRADSTTDEDVPF